MSELRSTHEHHDTTILSKDERNILAGLEYNDLPEKIVLSPLVLDSCEQVWQGSQQSHSVDFSKTPFERALAHYKAKYERGEDLENTNIMLSYMLQRVKKRVEYGKRIYFYDEKIREGPVHRGTQHNVRLSGNIDGYPDASCCVEIHSHTSQYPFSSRDILRAVLLDEMTPTRCLYIVITEVKLFLLFPTNQSPRKSDSELRELFHQIEEHFYHNHLVLPADGPKAQELLVAAACEKLALGFYSSARHENDVTLRRVNAK